MFKPNFTLNFRILNLLASIERLYGKIQGEKLIPSLSLRLSQENQILATHYSTSIEGNPTPTNSPGLTAGQMRKLARENSERAFQILLDIANNESIDVRPRERITAAQLIIDRAFGKSREEPEEEKDTETATAKILKLVGKKTDKKD